MVLGRTAPQPPILGEQEPIQSPQNWGFGGLKCRNKQLIWYNYWISTYDNI
jgi:hypothetical protein